MDTWLAAVFGLAGVLLGALLASVFELWRRALDGQAAARVIRVETMSNRVELQYIVDGAPLLPLLNADAWQAHRLTLAWFLSELQLIQLANLYADMSKVGQVLEEKPRETGLHLSHNDAQWIRRWLKEARQMGATLRGVERGNPLRLALSLLRRRRVATDEEITGALQAHGIGAGTGEEAQDEPPD